MHELLLILVHILLGEVVDTLPSVARFAVKLAAKNLPEDYKDTLEETWLGELDQRPGKLYKLTYIVPLILERAEVMRAINEAKGIPAITNSSAITFARFFDIFFGIIALVVLLPFYTIIALAIRLETKGTQIYVSKKLGMNSKVIRVYKFRTMHMHAEDRLRRCLAEDPEKMGYWLSNFRMPLHMDPRFTQVGKFLKVTGLEDLLLCVSLIKGDISLVGPPIVSDFPIFLTTHTALLKNAKPGIFSLSSATLDENDVFGGEKWLESEEYYQKHWTITLYFRVILLTVIKIFKDSYKM